MIFFKPHLSNMYIIFGFHFFSKWICLQKIRGEFEFWFWRERIGGYDLKVIRPLKILNHKSETITL